MNEKDIQSKWYFLFSVMSLGFPGSSVTCNQLQESTCNAGDLGWEGPMEKGMATHSSILAWRFP